MRARRSGMIIEQFAAAMLVILTALPVTLTIAGLLYNAVIFPADIQDETALAQLRHILIVSDNYHIDNGTLAFTYHEQDWQLCNINNKLIMKPGTVIFLTETDTVNFYEQAGIIYVRYTRKEKEYTRALVHK